MNITPYPFQLQAVDFHIDRKYSLNLFEMGMGKTIIALTMASKVEGKVLITCPSFLRTNWELEIVKVLGSDALKSKFEFITYSQLSKACIEFGKDVRFIIADEIHYLKSLKAARTINFLDLLLNLQPEYFLGLTGTPIKNRIPEFYTLLSFVSLNPAKCSGIDIHKYFPNFRSFCERYCDREINEYSGQAEYFGLRPERREEFAELLRGKILKIPANKVLNLPPLLHIRHNVGLAEMKALNEEFKTGAGSEAKRQAAVNKVRHTVEYVSNIYMQGEGPVVIFTDHIASAEAIARELGVIPITGKTSMDDRTLIMREFLKKGSYLVATIGSFSVGVNLVNSRHLVFNDLSWVPANNYQAMKRIHRIGQTRPCNIHYVLGGPIDTNILTTLQTKMAMIDTTNEMAFNLSMEVGDDSARVQ